MVINVHTLLLLTPVYLLMLSGVLLGLMGGWEDRTLLRSLHKAFPPQSSAVKQLFPEFYFVNICCLFEAIK